MNRRQRRAARKVTAMFAPGAGGPVRLSTLLRNLRRAGKNEIAAQIQASASQAARCETHGDLADPVVGIVRGARAADLEVKTGCHRADLGPDDGAGVIVYGCPWCSDASVLEAWEREGMAS